MKIKSELRNGVLYFEHFCVKKESESFYGVYEFNSKFGGSFHGSQTGPITSAPTMNAASKKAKLLEIGYQTCKEEMWEWP